MGVDVGSVAGIGFEASDLFSRAKDNAYSIEYYSLMDEGDLDEDFFEELTRDLNHIKYGDSFDMSGEGEYYILAKDPVKGVQDFLDELNGMGFHITIDDVSFINEAFFW